MWRVGAAGARAASALTPLLTLHVALSEAELLVGSARNGMGPREHVLMAQTPPPNSPPSSPPPSAPTAPPSPPAAAPDKVSPQRSKEWMEPETPPMTPEAATGAVQPFDGSADLRSELEEMRRSVQALHEKVDRLVK